MTDSEDGDFTAGNKLATLRDHFNLSQEEIAEVMGVCRGTISSYETRHNASPNPKALRALSARYGIDLGWFIDGVESPIKLEAKGDEQFLLRKIVVLETINRTLVDQLAGEQTHRGGQP